MIESGQRGAGRLGPIPFPHVAATAKCGEDAQERNWSRHTLGGWWRCWITIAGKNTYLCTPETPRPIGKFIVKMIVVHISESTVPIDIAKMSMTHVQVIVGQQHTILSAGTVDAKTVKCNAE
jgi:hypothetical protein